MGEELRGGRGGAPAPTKGRPASWAGREGWRGSLEKETTAGAYCLQGPSLPDRPSCITDRNLFHGQNVGQLCRPPPFVTFDLTSLPVTAAMGLPHLTDVTTIYPMTVQLTHCDMAAVKSSPRVGWQLLPLPVPYYGSFCWKAALLHCACGSYRKRLLWTKTVLCKGSLPQVYQALLIAPPLYFCFQCAGKESRLIVFEGLMVKGPTDTTTVGVRLCHLSPSRCPWLSSFSVFHWVKEGRNNSGFSWVLSSFLPSHSLLLCVFVYQTASSISLFIGSPVHPVYPGMPVFKVHLLSSVPPFASSFTDSTAVCSGATKRDLFTRGKGGRKKKKKHSCYQWCHVNALYFSIGWSRTIEIVLRFSLFWWLQWCWIAFLFFFVL